MPLATTHVALRTIAITAGVKIVTGVRTSWPFPISFGFLCYN
jgi:hypothetical protein